MPSCSCVTRQEVDPHRLREDRRRVSVGADRSSAAHPAPVCGRPLVDTAVVAVVVVEVVVAAAVAAVAAVAVQPLVAGAQSLGDLSAPPIAGRTDDLGVLAPRLDGTGLRNRPWRRQARSPATPRVGC